MDVEDVLRLIEAGENVSVEFKRGRRMSLNDADLVETAVCMANGPGGVVLVGVEDDGRISGTEPRHGDRTDPSRVEALILNRTVPPLSTEVTVVATDHGDVLVITVPPAASPVGTKDGVFKRRSIRNDGKPECVPYAPHEMFSTYFSLTGQDYAQVVARGAGMADLDPVEFERFRRLARQGPGDSSLAQLTDEEIGRALGVISFDQGHAADVTLGGILLFGRETALDRYIPNAEAAFQVLDDTRVRSNTIFRSPLFQAAEELFSRVQAHNSEEEFQWGLIRVAVQRIPERAARESIANALVHRDYAETGMTVVQLHADTFTVTSPGGFPPGVTQLNLLDESKPRSRTLADAFKRAGLVERSGRGINLMYDALLRTGRAAPDFTKSTDRSVSATFGTDIADLGMARFIVTREGETGRPFALDELRVLHELRALSAARVNELVSGVHLTEVRLRRILTRLVEQGLVEQRGVGRGRRFHLSAAFYRLTEDSAAYIRVRGTEPIQHEQMVVEYTRQFGTISRAKAADLCMIDPQQASKLLQRMHRGGQLVRHGERRGTYYTVPESS